MLKQIPEKLLNMRRIGLEVFLDDFILRGFLPLKLFFDVNVLLHTAGGETVERDAPVIQIRDKREWT